MTTIDYLMIGHITADIIPNGRILGGTASYAARNAKAFGLKVGILTSARADDPLLEELAQYGEVVNIPAEETTTFKNIYEDAGRKQYIHGVAAPITLADVPEKWHDAPLVHIAPMADEVEPQIAHLFTDKLTLMTPQGWMRRWDADGLVGFKPWFDAEIVKTTTITVFSEEDITQASHLEQDFAQAASKLVVTRAYHGGTYYVDGIPATYQAVKTDAVDPTGAGDIFATSLFAAYHETKNFELAVQAAAMLAANSITRVGISGAPTPEEVQSVRQRLYDR